MAVQDLHTIVLQVSHLEDSISFYEKALGVTFSRPSGRAAEARCGSVALLLHVDHEAFPERRGAGTTSTSPSPMPLAIAPSCRRRVSLPVRWRRSPGARSSAWPIRTATCSSSSA